MSSHFDTIYLYINLSYTDAIGKKQPPLERIFVIAPKSRYPVFDANEDCFKRIKEIVDNPISDLGIDPDYEAELLKKESNSSTLKERAFELSKQLLKFCGERDSGKPIFDMNHFNESTQSESSYDSISAELYKQKFQLKVVEIYDELKQHGLSNKNFDFLYRFMQTSFMAKDFALTIDTLALKLPNKIPLYSSTSLKSKALILSKQISEFNETRSQHEPQFDNDWKNENRNRDSIEKYENETMALYEQRFFLNVVEIRYEFAQRHLIDPNLEMNYISTPVNSYGREDIATAIANLANKLPK